MRNFFFAALLFFPLRPQAAEFCTKWAAPVRAGVLDHELIEEASGLAYSSRFQRLYHVNDSGDGPYFYQSSVSGRGTRRIEVLGFEPQDVEAMGLGPCGKGTCVFIGDIGAGNRIDITLIGNGVNLAKRLESACEPCRIMFDSATKNLLMHSTLAENALEKRHFQMKHHDELLEAYEYNPFVDTAEELGAAMKKYQKVLNI